MSINKTLFRQQLDELKRAGNERRLRELQSKYQSPETIDYSNMSLRDELQTRFDLDEMNNLSTKLGAPSGLAVGNDNGAPVQDLSQRLSGNDTGSAENISMIIYASNAGLVKTAELRPDRLPEFPNHLPIPLEDREIDKVRFERRVEREIRRE